MAYQKVNSTKFLIGLTIVTVPLVIMVRTGNETWAWRYVALIILGLLLVYNDGISTFVKYIGGSK